MTACESCPFVAFSNKMAVQQEMSAESAKMIEFDVDMQQLTNGGKDLKGIDTVVIHDESLSYESIEYERKRKMDTKVKVKLSPMAFLPERAHDTDAGADIRTPESFRLAAHSSEIVATGVHVQLPPNTVGMLKSKSGLNIKHDIISEGVIDEGFSGEIIVKLYNMGGTPYLFHRGDKITQLVVMPVHYVSYEQADEIQGGDRGEAGYGSTGR